MKATVSKWAPHHLPRPLCPHKKLLTIPLHFCTIYCKLTMKGSYFLLCIDDWIDPLGKAIVFSALDAYSGYSEMHNWKKDRFQIAFVTHSETIQYIRTPFGLTSAPASFQQDLDVFVTRNKWKSCLVFLDNTQIYSNTIDKHTSHGEDIFHSLKLVSITL